MNENFDIIKKLYDYHGLPSREFNRMATAKHDGHLYFGTLNGMCKLDPLKVLQWEESYQLSIDRIQTLKSNTAQIFDPKDSIDVDDSTEALTIDYNLTDFYKIPYNEGSVNFTSNQEEIDIVNEEDRLTIKNLSAGMLELRLMPHHSNDVQKLAVNIVRDYSSIAKWFLIIATMILLAVLVAYSIIQYNKKKEEQKTSTNKKISELQLSALQGQMNPHFIFNALGAIQYLQYFIQTNDTNKADEYLSDFALLMRGILDSSSKKFISLKEELNLLKLYTNLEKARFENKFEVNFKISSEVDEETLIPPMIIQPYVENAINHGLHHLKSKQGKLDIILDNKLGSLNVTVRDNGIGRKAAGAIQVGKKHKSKGMSITQDRIETLNSSSDISISMDIKDLKEDSIAAGTEVNLLFKDV